MNFKYIFYRRALFVKVRIFQVCFFLISVKYLREVTPYFRKASIISEVGWELQRGFLSGAPPTARSPQRADTRYLPLQLCHLARNFRYADPGNCPLTLSPSSSREMDSSSEICCTPRAKRPRRLCPRN